VTANVNSPRYVLGFTLAVSAGFTAAITSLQVATRGMVQRNAARTEEKAIVSVFGLGDVRALTPAGLSALVERRVDRSLRVRDPETGREFPVLRAYRTEAERGARRREADLAAIAFSFAGVGFWAPIKGLMALTPDRQKVVGLVFVEQAETPGLGGRITEASFQEGFKGLDVTLPAKGARFLYIGGGAPTGPQDPRHGRYVDAITGATQTSLAVGRFLDENLRQFQRAMAAAPKPPGKQ
jgi:Na+-transporting NADH:ubiquinone oxidoreductase subunit C